MLICYNRGCGQTYDPATNSEESCRHHPGAPYFHDAYKGWSCCKKKSVDFTEFLSIKGCTLSKHSNVKPPEPEKQAMQINTEKDIVEEQPSARAPIQEALQRPPIDTPLVSIAAKVSPTLKQAIDALQTKSAPLIYENLSAGEVSLGTVCKNSGCTYAYTGTHQDDTICSHHPGVPIFHEGMKYWSCCQRKTSDFAVFMAQRGCVDGQHKWFKENENKKVVQCRFDWHQTASDVIVSIYAKLYHYELSSISVNPIRLHVSLLFPEQNDAKFELDMELRGIIDVNRASAQMYGTKVEITLPKAEPGLWSKLDFPIAKLPPAQLTKEAATCKQTSPTDSGDDFDLDDIETFNPGMRLSEIAQQITSDADHFCTPLSPS